MYAGTPGKLASILFANNFTGPAFDILRRTTSWSTRFPYVPQTIYGTSLMEQSHERNWYLQVSAGASAMALIDGAFGLRPALNGSLVVAPSYDAQLYGGAPAQLQNYIFRNHTYALTVSEARYELTRDGQAAASAGLGQTVICAAPAGWPCRTVA